MFYSLVKNVYFVKGAKNGCIYDFNCSKLYSVNQQLSEQMSFIAKGMMSCNKVEKTLQNTLDQLVELNVLSITEYPVPTDIKEIGKQTFDCEFAWIEITRDCNLRCVHCYNEAENNTREIMPFDDYVFIIEELVNLGVKKIQFIGGEPFYYSQLLKKMLEYAIGKFEFIEIFTNGTLIQDNWYEFLSQNKIHIALSMYSTYSTEHDKVTGIVGSWEKAQITLSKLRSYKIPCRVCSVLMKDIDLGEIHRYQWGTKAKQDIVRLSGRADFSLLSEKLLKKKLITKKSFQKPINKYFCGFLVSGHNCFGRCIYISANLTIYPCVMERRFSHGQVCRNNSFHLKEEIMKLGKDHIDICCNCEYRYACFDCRPDAVSSDIYAKPWNCTYNPLSGIWEEEDDFIKKLGQL